MRFQWDPDKARRNARKHGIRFADAVTALEDDSALTVEDNGEGERRWVTLGMDLVGRILVVAYSWRGDEIRIISARKAGPEERREYGIKK